MFRAPFVLTSPWYRLFPAAVLAAFSLLHAQENPSDVLQVLSAAPDSAAVRDSAQVVPASVSDSSANQVVDQVAADSASARDSVVVQAPVDSAAAAAPVSKPLKSVLYLGGGANSPLWRQIYADVFGCRVARAAIGQQAAALGAALVAGVGAGVWRDFSILESIARSDAEARPDASASSDYSNRYARWLALSGKLGEWAGTLHFSASLR